MFSLMSFHPGSRLFVTCLVGALALGLAGAVPGFASPVTGLRMSGPDLEVLLSAPEDGATAVLVDAAGGRIAEAPVSIEGGTGRALLAGAVAAIPGHGPAYRVTVVNEKGLAVGPPFPFLVALRCPPGAACRFQLLPGLKAPGTALVDPALGQALDSLPPGTPDLLDAAVDDDPALRGAALTAAWTWAALPQAPAGACGCFWTLEAALPGDALDGGAAVGLAAWEAQGEEAVGIERARTSSLALRQRCARAELRAGEAVTVADGEWSTVLTVPRVVLGGCAAACSPEISWEAEVEGRARAWVEGGGSEAAAAVSWQVALTVDGTEALSLEDGFTAAAGPAGGESERRASWSGDGQGVTLRAAARAEVAAPGGPTDAEAVAAVAWRLVGEGVSDCALASRVEVSLSSSSRLCPPPGRSVYDRPGEPGQIGLLTSGERCP